MKKYIAPIILFFFFALASCSDKNDNSKTDFLKDKNELLRSLNILGKATEKFNQLKPTDANLNVDDTLAVIKFAEQVKEYKNVLNEFQLGINESEKVSDEFLDNIHPEMKSMYRDKYIGSFKLQLSSNLFEKGFKYSNDKNKLAEIAEEENKQDKKVEEMQTEWFDFIQKHQDVLNDEDVLTGKKSDKSYWGMFWRFLVADFIATLLVSFLIVILILPITGIALLSEKIKSSALSFLTIPFVLVAGLGQLYFWVLWASFCVFHMHYYMDSPNVSHRWLYYLTGFFAAIAPMGYLSTKEQETADTNTERNRIANGSFMYILLTIVAYIVFCIYPNLMDYKLISFINDWLTKH